MSRILFAWEIGQNYGHLLSFLPVAQRLAARGHDVVLCLRDLSRAAPLLEPHGLPYLQAPVWLPAAAGLPASQSYADILLHHGFLRTDTLTGLVEAWRGLYDLLRPDLLILDNAPAALVAAADCGIRRVVIGTGFTIPPLADPLPGFRWWDKPSAAALAQTSARALQAINGYREHRGLPPWDRLGRLFEVQETFLCAYPELDHYDNRGDARYWGPLMNVDEGEPPAWAADADTPRIFGYVYPEDPRFSALMEALRALPADTVIHAPGLTAMQVRRLESARIRFSERPVRMSRIQREAHLVICHGGFGTVAAALMAGRPLLILPQQLEQTVLALRLQKLGMALVVSKEQQSPNWRKLCKSLVEDSRYATKAQALAAAHPDWSAAGVADAIADRCVELLWR